MRWHLQEPEEDWTPVPYWIDGGADVAETTCRACLKRFPLPAAGEG